MNYIGSCSKSKKNGVGETEILSTIVEILKQNWSMENLDCKMFSPLSACKDRRVFVCDKKYFYRVFRVFSCELKNLVTFVTIIFFIYNILIYNIIQCNKACDNRVTFATFATDCDKMWQGCHIVIYCISVY